AQTFGSPTLHLSPAGPATSGMQNVSAKTLGFVIRVEWNAEIASWIQQPTPDARKRLSEASSQEKTSGVMPSSKSAFAKRSASRVSFESIRMFSPDGSVSATPKLKSTERQLRLASAHCENWMPVGWRL